MCISFKPRDNGDKNANGSKAEQKRKIVYVWLESRKAVFIVRGEPKESKYSIGLPITPLYGKYRPTKDGKARDAHELNDFDVVLNIPKGENVDLLKGKKVVVVGFNEDEVLLVKGENDGGEAQRQ
jgi:hypothetical protein